MKNKLVLFGATGYTGRITAAAMLKLGLEPVLAGRNREKLDELAASLGIKQTALADISDPDSVASLIEKGDLLVSTVGPFTLYGNAAVEAAARKGAHYIDSTGEPGFIRRVFEEFAPRTKQSGALLMTAMGYDYVPGNLAASTALKEAGTAATRVDVGYFNLGKFDMSDGTRASVRAAILEDGRMFESGKLETRPAAKKTRTFSIKGKEKVGMSISSTEHYSLPKVFTELRDVNVYLGWFGSAAKIATLFSGPQAAMMKIPAIRRSLAKAILASSKSRGLGPDESARKNTRTLVVAEAFDASGKILARCDVEGVNGYDFTANFISWAAKKIFSGDVQGTGALGPVEAFGLESLTAGCKESGLTATVVRN